MRLLVWVVTGVVSLSAGAAGAVTVGVAPIRDTGKKGQGAEIRKQVEAGLEGGGLTVVGAPSLVKEAINEGFTAPDLDKPAVLMPVAKAVGADAVFTGVIGKDKGKDALLIHVYDLNGVELWSRPIPLKGGKLDGAVPAKIAKAVNAATASLGSGTHADPTPRPDPEVKPDPDPVKPEPEVKPEPVKPEPVKPDDSTDYIPKKPTKKPKPPVKKPDDGENNGNGESNGNGEDSLIDGPPVAKHEETSPAPPYIDGAVGGTITFRTYKLCPGVTSCSQPGPSPQGLLDVPVSYRTDTPYGGFSFWAEGFPVPRLVKLADTVNLTFGAMIEYSRSLILRSNYQDPTDGSSQQFRSSEQRFEGMATGRVYFAALGGVGYAGLYGGVAWRYFAVDNNPLVSESRRLAPIIGANVEVPLAANYVKFTGRLAFMPGANPGINETTLYGQTGAGTGYDLRGGFTGGYSYFGYSALVDYSHFADTYTGAGQVTTNGAVTEESYVTIYLLAHVRFPGF